MQKFLANSKCLNKEALWVSVIAYRKKKRKDEIVNPKADVSQKLKLWSYLLRRYKESANFMAFQTKCRTSVLTPPPLKSVCWGGNEQVLEKP